MKSLHSMRTLLALVFCFLLLSCFASGRILASQSTEFDLLTYSEQAAEKEDGIWPSQRFRQCFIKYWTLRFQGKLDKLYKMEVPYVPEMIPFKTYRNYLKRAQFNTLKKIEIRNIVKISDHCFDVKASLEIHTDDGERVSSHQPDRWIFLDGKWYHVLRDKLLFPKIS